jgi:Uma2 family endonuclease
VRIVFKPDPVVEEETMAVQFVQPHRFSVDQYVRMTEIGVLPEHGTELIDGVVVSGTRPFRFTSADFHRLAEAGILSEDDRVELFDGEIIEMTPVGSRHASCVSRLARMLIARAGDHIVRVQDPVHVDEGEDPQPDLAVVRARDDEYEDSHPVAADVLLLVEVADTSVLFDRTAKTERYAAAGIPELWLVDLTRDVIVVSLVPIGGQFGSVREFRRGDWWHSPALGGSEIQVDDVLGRGRPRR